MTLVIYEFRTEENELSSEFRYLGSVVHAEARKVFQNVTAVAWRPGLEEPATHGADYVLLIGRENVLIDAFSLRQLREAIDGGADIAVPSCLETVLPDLEEPLYTLRDFEQTEQRLPPRTDNASTPPSHLPLSLLSAAAFARVAEAHPVSHVLTEPTLLSTMPLRATTGAGLFHRFSDYYGEARADLLPYLPASAGHVLEIGCGRGHTGRLIQDALGCRVTGVEQHPGVAAEAAQRLWRVIVGDAQALPLDGRYDAIVASELVEHVADPDALLLKLKPLLAPDGRIVLSIPNVGHYSVVEDLLAGRWDYLPAGLLCYTHLRFFTRHTLVEWMQRLGFDCTVVPQTTELPERFTRLGAVMACDVESLRTRGFYVTLRS
jgi:SAM-dependent methyltransferase